jgi:hypothetical protein
MMFQGTRPTTDPATDAALKFSAAGKPGAGGARNDASPGAAQKVLELK